MTKNIPKEEWKSFFDEISKRRFAWLVNIEIINEKIGDQILDRELPLLGVTAYERRENAVIEISVGETRERHQSHSIVNPEEVAYFSKDGDAGGTVEILEKNGTKTLLQIIKPMPLVVDYSKDRGMAAS